MNDIITREEANYLNETIVLLDKKLDELSNTLSLDNDVFKEQNVEYLETLKSKNLNNVTENIYHDVNFMQSQLEDFAGQIELNKKLYKIYKKMVESPYFARMDIDNQNKIDSYYIGINSLQEENNHYKIVDWRSPISSLYYDFDLGKAYIENKYSKENCEIILKRQFKIAKGKLDFYFDTSTNIDDELLQEVLSKTKSITMKSIVMTIQQEQNKIIRSSTYKSLFVNGVAGSGKTAVAMHRVAYILYRMKESIKAKDILMLCPNNVFSSYISSILPELAEDDIKKLELDEIARQYLIKYAIVEKKSEQMDRLIHHTNQIDEFNYKSGKEFFNLLNEYCKNKIVGDFSPIDIVIGDTTIPKEQIFDLFINKYKEQNIFTRIKWICDNIIDSYFYNLTKSRKIFQIKRTLYKEILKFLPTKNYVKIYINFLKTLNKEIELNGNKLKNEDVYPLLFIKLFVMGDSKYKNILHLVIDEMQDYSYIQLKIIEILFPCSKTMVGDFSQSIISQTIKNNFHDFIAEDNNLSLIEINKTYRSTKQIADFYKYIGELDDVKCVNRNGVDVKFHKTIDIAEILNIINEYKNAGLKHIAIITLNLFNAKQLTEKLAKLKPILLDGCALFNIDNFLCISSVFVSKGLEFDGVIVYNASDKLVVTKSDYKLLYIASSRALHRLDITADTEFCDRINTYRLREKL